MAATCLAAIDVLEQEPEVFDRLWDNTRFFKAGLVSMGFDTGFSESPLPPVITGDGSRAMKLSDVTATHTRDEQAYALDAFKRVGTEIGLI